MCYDGLKFLVLSSQYIITGPYEHHKVMQRSIKLQHILQSIFMLLNDTFSKFSYMENTITVSTMCDKIITRSYITKCLAAYSYMEEIWRFYSTTVG